MRADNRTGSRARRSGGRKKFNVNFIVKTSVFLYNLLDREKEVVTIMMSLFDEEQIMKSFIRSERHESAQDKVKEKAILMLQKGKISVDEIQTFFPELSVEEIEEVKGEVMQLA